MAAELGGAQLAAQALLDHVIALDPRLVGRLCAPRPRQGGGRRRSRSARGSRSRVAAEAPRRFDALALLGALFEEAGDHQGALNAYRRALALDPKQDALQKIEERLRLDVEGRDI